MKILTYLLTFLIFGYIDVDGKEKKENKVVVPIAFYNLENLFDTINDPDINDEDFLPDGSYSYTSKIYNKKLQNLSDVISKLGVDVNSDGPALLGVSEIENREVLVDLIAQPSLKERKYKIVHFNSHDYRGVDVALIYNPKYFRVLSAKPLYMYIKGKEYITRSVLWVTGSLMGEKIHVFVNHWPSRRGGESATAYLREAGAQICRRVMDSLLRQDSSSNFIVMGDLNDDPTNNSVEGVLRAKPDIPEVKNPRDMYNPFYKFYKNGNGTTAYRDAWSLFDQIILGKDLTARGDSDQWSYLSAEVFNKPFMNQKFGRYKDYPLRSYSYGKWLDGYSDHYPVLVYLTRNMNMN